MHAANTLTVNYKQNISSRWGIFCVGKMDFLNNPIEILIYLVIFLYAVTERGCSSGVQIDSLEQKIL